MFLRRLRIEWVESGGNAHACPIAWIDSFAMRNFTNQAIFDDTLPVEDGVLEAGFRVPLEPLRVAMQDWFRRKGYLQPDSELRITPMAGIADPLLPSHPGA